MPQLVKAEAPFYPVHKGIRHFHTSKGQKQKGHRAKKNILKRTYNEEEREERIRTTHIIKAFISLLWCRSYGPRKDRLRARACVRERKKLKNERKEGNKTGGDRARRAWKIDSPMKLRIERWRAGHMCGCVRISAWTRARGCVRTRPDCPARQESVRRTHNFMGE